MIPLYLRVRPKENGLQEPWFNVLDEMSLQQDGQIHKFNQIFEDSDQVEIYDTCVRSLVDEVLEGKDQCFFTLGATGSGKTWTIEGIPGDPGVVYRAVQQVFAARPYEKVQISMMEIYNDRVFDLLNERRPVACRIINGVNRCRVNATSLQADSYPQAAEFLQSGYINRAVNSTACNSQSSRSHAIVFIEVGDARLTIGDLAGNERVNDAKSVGAQLQEAAEINKSLMVFGQALQALHSGRLCLQGSKLSSLLLVNAAQAMPVMLIAVDKHRNEKLGRQVLRYATIARKVTKPKPIAPIRIPIPPQVMSPQKAFLESEARLRERLYQETDARLVRLLETAWAS